MLGVTCDQVGANVRPHINGRNAPARASNAYSSMASKGHAMSWTSTLLNNHHSASSMRNDWVASCMQVDQPSREGLSSKVRSRGGRRGENGGAETEDSFARADSIVRTLFSGR